MVEKKRKKKEEKKEVKEIFEIEKGDDEKIIKKTGVVKEKPASKEQIEKENKILRNILVFIGVLALIVILGFFFVKSVRGFNYKGVKFDLVKEGELILYHTSFPVIYQGNGAEYNIYLRNDPRELEKKVPASGTLLSIEDTVINITDEFDCEGDEVIAIANLVNLYKGIGKNIMKDENASCDLEGRYMFVQIQPGNVTSVEKFGPNCYNLNVNNCEILEATERFIVGMLVNINNI